MSVRDTIAHQRGCAAGSMIAFGTGKLLGNVKKAYLQAGGMIFAGGVGGGVASVVGGGKFWDGFRNGLISAGLNHAMHYVYNTVQRTITIKQMLIDAGYKVRGIPTFTVKYIKDMIHKIPLLQEWYEKAGSPKIFKYSSSNDTAAAYYDRGDKSISVNFFWSDNNYRLLSNLFHEMFHGYQWESGFTDMVIKKYGDLRYNGTTLKAGYLLEIGAYGFQMSLGDTDARPYLIHSIKMFNKL